MRRIVLRVAAMLGAAALIGALMVAAGFGAAEPEKAEAANGADFNAGMIISDAIFYNPWTMSVDGIQSFLNARVPTCRAGYTCLKDYWETTRSQPARAEGCAAYAGQSESAARIIYKVATACGINPQALIVLLEKEQGLVSDSWPTSRQYRSATGYGCPDTADCDANYYGFFNQVYHAAWQFKKYQAYPTIRGYQAGRWNTILWHPNSGCGTSQVYIQNQATAGLYVYTPYRPNQAALNNLYGSGDGCSSYGNRNFWRIFTDWFGSTSIAVNGAIYDAWIANGGATGSRLGAPVKVAVSIAGGGLMQQFQHGWLIWRSDLGAKRLTGATAQYYFAYGGAGGGLGYPTTDVAGADAVEHYQDFEFGHLSWKPGVGTTMTGGFKVLYLFHTNWRALQGSTGVLGWPLADAVGEGSNWASQRFERGRLLWNGNSSIMYWLPTAVWDYWKATGGFTGSLGWPVDSPLGSATAGWTQEFYSAKVAMSAAGAVTTTAGGFPVSGVWAANWNALKSRTGVLGYPLAGVVDEGSGWSSQRFERGRLLYYGSASVMYWMPTAIWDYWKANGGLGGAYGPPVDSPVGSAAGGWTQDFAFVRLGQTAAGVVSKLAGGYVVSGVWATNWNALKSRTGVLGYPTGPVTSEGSGWSSQPFERGRLLLDGASNVMYWLPTAVWDHWKANGGLTGALGRPIDSPVGSAAAGWTQEFYSAKVAMSAAGVVTITAGGFAVTGVWAANWDALKSRTGVLGYPLAGVVDEGSGWSSQRFERGRLIYNGSAQVMYWVPTAIWDYWKANGGLTGSLGAPIESPVGSATTGWMQPFQSGTLRSTPSGGVTRS